MRPIRLALALAAGLWSGAPAPAQESAALVADTLVVTADERLVATGHVQAFYGGTTLSAARVTYDRRADRLLVEGPILIRDADGAVLEAAQADLDPRLEDGLLRGARLVLDRQLQIAANRVDRDGSLTALTGAAATSCQVCPGRAPLWEIRAGQVVLDEARGLLTFDDARFLVRGVPILWVPRLRFPAPGNDRATGLLIPRLRAGGTLGLGIEVPYFIVLGPTRDVTLSPLVTTRAASLGLRYRQAFANGDLELRGALGRDGLRPGAWRGYATAEGLFRLQGGLDLAFDVSAASDPGYPRDYGLGDGDRLESALRLGRAGASSLLEGEVSHVRDLGGDDAGATVAGLLAWEARRRAAGGTLTWGASLDGVRDDGERMLRAGAFGGWEASRVWGPGLVLETEARLAVDAYARPAEADGGALLRAVPAVGATLRWPLLRRAGATADLLEPILSLGWTGEAGGAPPDLDSRLPELDGANLHALSRMPGEDAVERGARLAFGVAWTRQAPGVGTRLALGRLWRATPFDASAATGLGGSASDWLVEGRADIGRGLSLDARALLDDGLGVRNADAGLRWESAAGALALGYVRLAPDPAAERPDRVESLSLSAEWRPSDRWTLAIATDYDLARDRAGDASLGVTWRSECVEVDVSVSRGYTTPGEGSDVDFGLSVDLLGFSTGSGPRVAPGACRG